MMTTQLKQLATLPSKTESRNGERAPKLIPSTSPSHPLMPPEPITIEATGLPAAFLADLILKLLHQHGAMTGRQIGVELCLHFSGVLDPLLNSLKRNHLVEVKGGNHMNPTSFQYRITDKGTQQAKKSAERNGYVGPCPVTLEQYNQLVKTQTQQRPEIGQAEVEHALKDLTLPAEAVEWVGSAVLSFKSLFLYGPPGNGKTSIAKTIGQYLLSKVVLVPYAIFADGQVIKVYDSESHAAYPQTKDEDAGPLKFDRRWVACRPPLIIVGGELMLEDLNLTYNDRSRYHEAPPQLKANGGMFLIDDFGRQQMEPKDLLNRWIVPLEEQIDYLRFHNGNKIAVPFETLIIFSTNLRPEDLIDGAFLRRLRHKLEITYPTLGQFYRIFLHACQERGLEFDEDTFTHLIKNYYEAPRRPYQACHARDLLEQLTDFAHFRKEPVRLTVELIDKAADSYFALTLPN